MAPKLSGLVQRFRPGPEPTDAELLARFTASRDEDAFAELVTRHGPLVFGVCRRVTGSHHLSEDAFQAVFVVLAAKAASVRAGSLPAFLHGVAARTALRARTVADRRRQREAPVGELPDATAADPAPDDLAAVVDEEVARLSEPLRAAVVLCELEGCSRKEAAERLGVPEGTVSSRLAAARKALADRLRRRGIAPGAAGLSAALGTGATAGVPAYLAARALAGALSPALRPAAVAALSTGVLRTMFVHKLKVVLPIAALALGALAWVAPAADRDPPPKPAPALVRAEPPAPKAAPKPLPKGPNKLFYWNDGKMVTADPDGKNAKDITLKDNRFHPSGARPSPDGKRIAYLIAPKPEPLPGPGQPQRALPTLHVRDVDGDGPGTDLGLQCESFCWSPDGTEIAGTSADDKSGTSPRTATAVVNLKTKAKSDLKLPPGHVVTDWAPDGRLLTTRVVQDPAAPQIRLYLMNRDGTEYKALTPDAQAAFGRLSPDGTRVLCLRLTFPKETPEEKKKREDAGRKFPKPQIALAVLDLATGKFAEVKDVPLNAEPAQNYCWSPDGKRIAYTWRVKHEGKPEDVIDKDTESHLIVCDPDGGNAKTVVSVTGKGQWQVTLAGVDWR